MVAARQRPTLSFSLLAEKKLPPYLWEYILGVFNPDMAYEKKWQDGAHGGVQFVENFPTSAA